MLKCGKSHLQIRKGMTRDFAGLPSEMLIDPQYILNKLIYPVTGERDGLNKLASKQFYDRIYA